MQKKSKSMSYEDKQFCSDFAELNLAKRGEFFCCYYAVTHYPKSLIFVQKFNFVKILNYLYFSVSLILYSWVFPIDGHTSQKLEVET